MKEMHSINKQWSEIYLGEKRKTLNESECEFVPVGECVTVRVYHCEWVCEHVLVGVCEPVWEYMCVCDLVCVYVRVIVWFFSYPLVNNYVGDGVQSWK
jgi:hypothetical protein